MPILNSVGALKEQNSAFSLIPISDTQWIAQLNSASGILYAAIPSLNGNVFLPTPGSEGLLKLNTLGSLVSVFNTNPAYGNGVILTIDKNENAYVGSTYDDSGLLKPLIIKYNSFGKILWQQFIDIINNTVLCIKVTPSNDLFVLVGDSNGGDPASGYGPYILFKINPVTGAIINQRKLLKYTSSAPSDLAIDDTTGDLLIAGTDYQTTSEILIGTYDYTNTDTASNMVYQSSGTDDYQTFFGGAGNQSIVTDSTYIYQVAYRVISGITRSVFMQIDKSTGAVNYSYAVTVGGGSLALYGITKDNSGNIYVTGFTSSTTGFTYIMQIDASTGSINWIKSLGTSIQFDRIDSATWSKGFLYFSATTQSGATTYYAAIKLKDDGSVVDGTYGTYWTFATPTPTLVSYMPSTTGTTTGSNNTTSETATTTSISRVSSSITITTYSL